MIHERISNFVKDHVHKLHAAGEYTSTPGMLFCLPAVIIFVIVLARLTNRYWTGRPRVAWRFVFGMFVFLFAAAGLEMIATLIQANHLLFSLESLLEESGEMIGVTIVVWSALELLTAEKLTVTFGREGLRFE